MFDMGPFQGALEMGIERDGRQTEQDPEQDDLERRDKLGRHSHVDEAAAPNNPEQPEHGQWKGFQGAILLDGSACSASFEADGKRGGDEDFEHPVDCQ